MTGGALGVLVFGIGFRERASCGDVPIPAFRRSLGTFYAHATEFQQFGYLYRHAAAFEWSQMGPRWRGELHGDGAAETGSFPATADRRVILVVEDEVLVRLAVSMHLREAGYTVIEARDAEEAIRIINNANSLDLVFSDVNMPGSIDGNELARWILQARPTIKVLLTSGQSIPGEQASFILKPYEFNVLVRRIQGILEQG
jgi:two-component system, response regulator PdtaR